MSKVENLEIDPAFWKVQIGSRVQDLEYYPLVLFPQPDIHQSQSLIPPQNLTQASVSSVPAHIFVPVSRQSNIPVPAQIYLPSSVAIPQPFSQPTESFARLPDSQEEYSAGHSNPDQDKIQLFAQLERLQVLLDPEVIPKPEEISVQSTNSSKDRAQLNRLAELLHPEDIPDPVISRSFMDTYQEFDV